MAWQNEKRIQKVCKTMGAMHVSKNPSVSDIDHKTNIFKRYRLPNFSFVSVCKEIFGRYKTLLFYRREARSNKAWY